MQEKIQIGCHVGPGATQVVTTVKTAKESGMTALQTFAGGRITRKVSWPSVPSDCAEEMRGIYGLVHAAYVLNICSSPNAELAQISVQCLIQTLEWAEACGFSAVVVHPGSAKENTPAIARSWCAANVLSVLDSYQGPVQLLLENTAGDPRGRLVGQKIEELEEVTSNVDDQRLGICVDTVHAWAAGYNIEEIKKLADIHPGIVAWHLNNPRVECERGGHKDRHGTWNNGLWGHDILTELLGAFREKPMVMETRTGPEDLLLVQKLLETKTGV